MTSSSACEALCPIMFAAVRGQIRRRGPCLRVFPVRSEGGSISGEIIGKRRVRIKVIRRVDFLQHLHDSESVFPADLLSAPHQMAISHRQIWRRDLTKQVTVNLQNNFGGSHAWRIANRKGGPGHTCKTSSRSSGRQVLFTEQYKTKVFSSMWCICRVSSYFLTG